jgi:sporulation protein YlmC with PRC-barrel domain
MATYTKQGAGPGPEVMGASTLIGDKVVNRQGENLGKVEEFMVDMDSGCIRYGVLSFGGFLGLGDKLFAIPFESLQLDTENECFILDVDKERLEKAPGFDKNNWPKMAQHEWGAEIHRYYGVTPYWEKKGYSDIEHRKH